MTNIENWENSEIVGNAEDEQPIVLEPKIEHIVISGGGIMGYKSYGVLREAHIRGIWRYNNIKTIYGTSAGAILGALISTFDFLNDTPTDWTLADNYFIKRPWHNVFKVNMDIIYRSYYTSGLLDKTVIEEIFEPWLKIKDSDTSITLQQHFDIFGIELHCFTTNLNTVDIVDISYKTHPDWTLIDAVYASCCLPVLFIPFEKDGELYFDGGILANYPIYHCLHGQKCQQNTILSIKKGKHNNDIDIDKPLLPEGSTILNYFVLIFNKVFAKLGDITNSNEDDICIPYEVTLVNNTITSALDIYLVASNMEMRSQLIDEGKQCFIQQLVENSTLPV
jgi:predicted acylesterase/phospholipase RssA